MIYLISYDLNEPDKDYSSIINAIKSYETYCRVLKSQWFIRSDKTAAEIEEHLLKHIDGNDRLLICEFGKNYGGLVDKQVVSWLKKVR